MIVLPLVSSVVASLVGVVTPGTPQSAAQEALDKLAKATDEREAQRLEEDVWDAWLSSGSPTVDILMTRGIAALRTGDTDLARDMFDRAIMIRPQYAEAWNRRATLFFNDGKYDQAIADIESTLRYEPRRSRRIARRWRSIPSSKRPSRAKSASPSWSKAAPSSPRCSQLINRESSSQRCVAAPVC
jgi:tetratricopeptide (TPR) repeat protein